MRRLIFPALCLATALRAQAHPAPARPAPAPAPAPAPTVRHAPVTTVSGFVYDSLSDAPLSKATVIIGGTAASAVTDSAGHYSIDADSVPDGTYQLSFFHPALDSIGIAPPPRTIVLKGRASLAVDLAMPSSPTIIRAVCPDSLRDRQRGLLLGDVRDAETDQPLAGAFVVVQWAEMTLGNSTLSRLPQALSTRTDSDGLFRICGIPSQTPLRAQARKSPKASGFIDLNFPPSGLVVQQFLIGVPPKIAAAPPGAPGVPATTATAAAPLGSSTLVGSVVGADGNPLEGAQVLLIGTTLTVSAKADAKGNFRLNGLPSGTHTVEVRLLSYQPKHYVVNLAPHREAHLVAKLDTRAQVLDPVVVTAKETTPVPGFDQRAARETGVFMTAKQIEQSGVMSTSDLFRRVPGMQVVAVNGQYVIVGNRSSSFNCTEVQWYVDGVQYQSNGDDMDAVVKPNEIEAIEVYSSATDTPMQFQGPQSQCGTVVLWTKRAHVKQKTAPAPAPAPSSPPG